MLKDMVVARNWRELLRNVLGPPLQPSGRLRRFQGSGGRIHNPLGSGPGRASRPILDSSNRMLQQCGARAGEAGEPHLSRG
jgi:hypothetical protein